MATDHLTEDCWCLTEGLTLDGDTDTATYVTPEACRAQPGRFCTCECHKTERPDHFDSDGTFTEDDQGNWHQVD